MPSLPLLLVRVETTALVSVLEIMHMIEKFLRFEAAFGFETKDNVNAKSECPKPGKVPADPFWACVNHLFVDMLYETSVELPTIFYIVNYKMEYEICGGNLVALIKFFEFYRPKGTLGFGIVSYLAVAASPSHSSPLMTTGGCRKKIRA
eukprot:scaffold6103_cov130-Amphora_coffeaeformis.AAC.1